MINHHRLEAEENAISLIKFAIYIGLYICNSLPYRWGPGLSARSTLPSPDDLETPTKETVLSRGPQNPAGGPNYLKSLIQGKCEIYH